MQVSTTVAEWTERRRAIGEVVSRAAALQRFDGRDERRGLAGTAVGLSYVAAYGIDTGRHDGITHPRTYDRLVETLLRRFHPSSAVAQWV